MSLLSFIESLEKEQDVDLKKEIVEMMAKQPFFIKAKDQIAFARHFYELGCRHAAVLYDDIEFERQRRCEKEKSEIPTIPQGIDEAARFGGLNYIDTIPEGGTAMHPWNDTDVERAYEEGMKAGAKWMAEQGVSEDAVIEGFGDVAIVNYSYDVNLSELLADKFADGDKVIVQIRKK